MFLLPAVWLSTLLVASASPAPGPRWTEPAKDGFDLDSTGHINRTVASGRTCLLHVPPGYTSRKKHALVLSFHGAGGTSVRQEHLSQLSDPDISINDLPILAAYPQGADNSDENRKGVWYGAPYANKSVDDVQFTKDIISDISSAYSIDQRRIYASGKSNGGGFAAYLACRPDTSKIFAAFAPVSPALYPGTLAFSGCDPARPVPIINSHGVLDQTIPFDGRLDKNGTYGTGTATINVTLWREQWAERNGCRGQPRTSTPFANTTETYWSCGPHRSPLAFYTVHDLGHSWPTTMGLDSSGAPNNTASFNLTTPPLIDFFNSVALPGHHVER